MQGGYINLPALGIKVCTQELVLEGTLRQEMDWDKKSFLVTVQTQRRLGDLPSVSLYISGFIQYIQGRLLGTVRFSL
jgi:hypothetical protein